MSFKINVNRAKTIEPDDYRAILESVEEKETVYGERLIWLFRVPEHGVQIAGFTSRSESTLSKPYRWATVLNPAVAAESSWGPDDVVGKECTVVVDVYQGDKGTKNRVSEVKR